jgi:hypothetical protein
VAVISVLCLPILQQLEQNVLQHLPTEGALALLTARDIEQV